MIAAIPPVTAQVRPLNERLWELVGKDVAGTITPQENAELIGLCAALEQQEA